MNKINLNISSQDPVIYYLFPKLFLVYYITLIENAQQFTNERKLNVAFIMLSLIVNRTVF